MAVKLPKLVLFNIFFSNRIYYILGGCTFLCLIGYFFPILFPVGKDITLLALLALVIDFILLFAFKGKISAFRTIPRRMGMGEDNTVVITLQNSYRFPLKVAVIDELPFQFQKRNFEEKASLPARSEIDIEYNLKPLSRGEYHFGDVQCYTSTFLGLVQRRYTTPHADMVKVYPAFQLLRRYQLLFLANKNNIVPGIKKLRRLGHSLEFEKIKNYVSGDDVRHINWKATARTAQLMVNVYSDTRQQQIYCMIDKGRTMKMPFDGMTLLDYAINAALSLLHIALLKHDKAGLITFAQEVSDFVPADKKKNQLTTIIETLYSQSTNFMECDYQAVWAVLRKNVTQRAFLLFFTNFESITGLERQLPFIKQIASKHLVCVVFFQNTLLKEIYNAHADTTEGIYVKTIADQLAFEKRQIVKELRHHGVIAILSTPQQLSVNVINQYLELKANRMI